MATFDISCDSKTTVALDAGRGSATFSITNLTPQPRKVFVSVAPSDPADRGLFTLDKPPEQFAEPNRALTVMVQIAAGKAARPGTHAFTLKVTDVDRPDMYFGESQPVSFAVPEIVADTSWKRWLAIAAALVLALLIGAGGWYLYMYPRIDDYHRSDQRNRNVDVAADALTQSGMDVTTSMTTLVSEPALNRTVIMQMNGDEPADGPVRVRRGTRIHLDYAVLMPVVKDLRKADAITALKNAGIAEGLVDFSTKETVNPAEADRILDQTIVARSPDASDPSRPGGVRIALTVGISPQPVAIENVVNVPFCDAQSRLRSAGFVVFGHPDGVVPRTLPWVSISVEDLGRVITQSLQAGTPHPPGTRVDLVYRGRQMLCLEYLEFAQPGLIFEMRQGGRGQ